MSKIDDGGWAFPHILPAYNGEPAMPISGMTLRDWFAGQALSAIITHALNKPWQLKADDTGDIGPATCRTAYDTADAMLEARKRAAQ